MTPAPVATDGEVFSRRATGLVRLGTPWRALVLNFANIGLTYITWLLAFASTYIAGEVRSSRRTQTAGTVGGTCMYAAVVTLLLAAIAIPVTLAFNKSAAWMNYNSDKYDEILPLDPTFVTWASALVDNAVVLAVVGIGLVTWSFFSPERDDHRDAGDLRLVDGAPGAGEALRGSVHARTRRSRRRSPLR